MDLEKQSAKVRSLIALLVYPAAMAALSAALDFVIHEFGSWSFATFLRFGMNAIVFPFVLGIVIQRILVTRRLVHLLPIALGPFVYLLVRLSLDAMDASWIADQLAELLAVSTFSAAVATFGAWIGGRISHQTIA